MRKKAYNCAPESAEEELPAPRIAENGYRLPDPLPLGLILTDSRKRQWILGKSIGCGGFGEIYCAKELPESFQSKSSAAGATTCGRPSESDSYNRQPRRRCVQEFVEKQTKTKNKKQLQKLCKDSNYPFVIKVDHLDGPLYPEMHFYHRVAKPKLIDNWMLTHRLAFLGMPRHVGSGIVEHTVANTLRRYRFLVMDRLGVDLQKILNKQGNILNMKSAYTIAMMTLDILAYIHSFGYIHADIKASNLLLGRLETESPARELYLVDYGLVEKFRNQFGEHKEEEEDNRRANSGTIEFTSRDGHVGALTRRSDLEILVYNTISWLSGGRLPWIECKDHETVRKQKEYYMSHIDELLKYAFKSKAYVPKGLEEFVRTVTRLGFKEDPDYDGLKMILIRALISSGYNNDGLITWGEPVATKLTKKGNKRSASYATEVDFPVKNHRKGSKQELEQFEMLDIPRKMIDRNRLVRSAPTTGTNRQRSGSISPTQLLESIELSNPTPQMLEVLERIRQKAQMKCDYPIDSVDSKVVPTNGWPTSPKRRLKTVKRKTVKWPVITSKIRANASKLKSSVIYEPVIELNKNGVHSPTNGAVKSSKKTLSKNKKCSVITKNAKVCMSPRIPLQKLEINVKTSPTTPTKRCSSRTVDTPKKPIKTIAAIKTSLKRKKKQSIVQQKSKSLVTRSKSKTYSSSKVLVKLSSPKKLRNGSQFKNRVALVVDLPSSPLRCGLKPMRSAINSSKRVIK